MKKIKNDLEVEKTEDIHYSNIPLDDYGKPNSILTINTNGALSKDEKAKLFDYFVVNPINLSERSRKFFDLKSEKNIDFTCKKLRDAILKIYNFDDNTLFCLLKPTSTINVISEWFENGIFPSDEVVSLERICIKSTYGRSKIPALIRFVRNCICHGNFEIKIIGKNKKYIVLEDNTGTVIRGRGSILLKRLFEIIETIHNFDIDSDA